MINFIIVLLRLSREVDIMEAGFTVCTRNQHWEYDVSAALVAAFFRMINFIIKHQLKEVWIHLTVSLFTIIKKDKKLVILVTKSTNAKSVHSVLYYIKAMLSIFCYHRYSKTCPLKRELVFKTISDDISARFLQSSIGKQSF